MRRHKRHISLILSILILVVILLMGALDDAGIIPDFVGGIIGWLSGQQ